ncbi:MULTISPECIES: hypothetical protein [unclassified Bradyrhizobium]
MMVKRRRRFKQPTSLAHRLAQEMGRLRELARGLPPGTEQSMLLRKAHQAETALRIDTWLASPGTSHPVGKMSLMGRTQPKRR